ncbi:SoxR reducing system RseC family protein [Ferrimonas marina]|uniref:Positive regulator of sigma(E), RseC/MucC n=1 Tax=Ferrimonas marina TaxID=299255 RepID=A0A1M5ZGB6_9GAMM|nr:SoxR reducing system RseC family protein [Ferrimonas marina]SHI23287.1 positive regulator of sigma(E), RseC/MucC [Ferrimonas marina]
MIEAIGRVEAWHQGQVTISWRNQSACGHCDQGEQCGTSVVAKALVPKENRLTLPCQHAYPVGTQLRIGIAEQDLLHLSAMVYLLPLLAAIAAALLARWMGMVEGGIILSTLLGGGLGFVMARRWARRQPGPLTILGQLGPSLGST